ncbi:MAG: DUF58 domain-containing protein [Coriobacteriales bacterium]
MARPGFTRLTNARGRRQRKRAQRQHALLDARRIRRSNALKACACILLLALCALLALMVGNSEYKATAFGWVPLIMVLTGLLIAFAYLQVLKHCLDFVETSSLRDCQRDREIEFTVAFTNRSPLFFFKIEAYFYISDLYGNKASRAMTTLSLSPFESYELSFKGRFEHIGTYSAGLEKVRVVDFLNLFSATIPNERVQRVQVTPKLQLLDGIRFSTDAMQEAMKASKTIMANSMDYAYVREYVPGDPLKTIHWKLSSRNADERYLTRLYEMPTNPAVGVVMDFYGPSNEAAVLMGFFDAVVESCFSLARYARFKGMDVEVHYRDKEGSHARLTTWNQDKMPQIVQSLPLMSNDPSDALGAMDILREEISGTQGQNNLVVCTANLSAEMVNLVCEARAAYRSPLLVAVVPSTLVGRERDDYTAKLARLDALDIGYVVISSSDDLVGVVV